MQSWDDDLDDPCSTSTLDVPFSPPEGIAPGWEPDFAPDSPLTYAVHQKPAIPCTNCRGTGTNRRLRPGAKWQYTYDDCPTCGGVGFHQLDPAVATCCIPGSPGKVAVLAARYAMGVPLYIEGDATCENQLANLGGRRATRPARTS